MLKKAFIILFLVSYLPCKLSAQIDSLLIKLEKEKFDTAKVDLMNQIAYSYQKINPDLAFEYVQKASDLAKEIKYKSGYCHSCNTTGGVYFVKSDFENAQKHFQEALLCFQKIKDNETLPKVYTNIAMNYDAQGNYNESFKYHLKGLKIVEESENQTTKPLVFYSATVL